MGSVPCKVVFESFELVGMRTVRKYVGKGVPMYVIEPSGAYHVESGPILGFPRAFPRYVSQLIRDNTFQLLSGELIDGKNTYCQAIDKAVDVVEEVFPLYRQEHQKLFEYVTGVLGSPVAEDMFKKRLCDRLAKFYSVEFLLNRVQSLIEGGRTIVYLNANVLSYLRIRRLLLRGGQITSQRSDIHFPRMAYVAGALEDAWNATRAFGGLLVQALASGVADLIGGLRRATGKKGGRRKDYVYGVFVVSPKRQLAQNQRGPDFIVDGKKIRSDEVICFAPAGLADAQKACLEKLSCDVFSLPKLRGFFSNGRAWAGLLVRALKGNWFSGHEEILGACVGMLSYFMWLHVLQEVRVKHFITHCDFGTSHIGRNVVLGQAGVETWYFTDSANIGCNWRGLKAIGRNRHPYWCYLHYDHLVTWSGFLADYFKEHPGTFKQIHVVGCLWSQHISSKRNVSCSPARDSAARSGQFIIVAFDTTYGKNGFAGYAEGLEFAQHLLRLTDSDPEIVLCFKEKKDRSIHSKLDPDKGPQLVELYKRIGSHPRINITLDDSDSSEMISGADMVVSFPFTSTTLEALSANVPAVWHDPLGCFKQTLYGHVGGVITHSYEELKAKVLEIKNMKPDEYRNPIPAGSPLMDPYRDGKAIDRFRDLLVSK